MISILALTLALIAAGGEPAQPEGVERIRQDAVVLRSLVESPVARAFLDAAKHLPTVSERSVYRDPESREYLSPRQVEKLDPAPRGKLEEKKLDETFYYNTKYGSPLAYVRALEILGQHGLSDVQGKKLLDFGYGTIGHLRMLASLGADTVGVDVDTLLPALYSRPDDTGEVAGRAGPTGRVTLVHGHFPADEEVNRKIGEGYDLFISKNTLKNGYLHPERPADPRRLLHLGVDDETFVRALFRILKPGGRVMIYNLYPAQAPPDKPYIPWADGRCPFPRSLWESAGFKVIAFDVNDDEAARAMGHALGWDEGEDGMDLQNDLFALYTIVEKPR